MATSLAEIGVRGPWLLELREGSIHTEQLALAPLAYAAIELNVSELEVADDLSGFLLDAAKKTIEHWLRKHPLPDAMGLRIRLIGETNIGSELESAATALEQRESVWDESGCQLFFDRIRLDTQPAIDLVEHARQTDAIGLLARDLLILEGPDNDRRRALIRQGRQAITALAGIDAFKRLDAASNPEQWLLRAGRTALRQMLAARE